MRKLIALVMTLVFALGLSACDNVQQERIVVYSFCGENEQFAIFNGVIVLGDVKEVFDGGDLKILQTELFSEITSYSTTFYMLKNGEQRTILSNSVVDMTGGSVNVNGDLGRVSGDSILTVSKVENTGELINNLWCELNTTDVNGMTNTYQLQLTLTEITSNPDK